MKPTNSRLSPSRKSVRWQRTTLCRLFLRLRRPQVEVKFNMTWRDWLEGYRIGLSHLTLPYRLFWIGILLLFPSGEMLTLYGRGYPLTWTAANLPLRLMLIHSAMHLGVMLLSVLSTSAILGYFFRRRRVQITPRCLAYKQLWGYNRIRWKDVTDIVEDGHYIFFCQNVPVAVVVPNLAFRCQEQANVFLEQAIQYWREARGILPPLLPDTPGVWPPAPRPGA